MHRLARDLGYVNVDLMGSRVSEYQLARWALFYAEDSEGKRADRRAAIIAHTIYVAMGGKGRSVESFEAVDHHRAQRLELLKMRIRQGGQ